MAVGVAIPNNHKTPYFPISPRVRKVKQTNQIELADYYLINYSNIIF